MTKRSRVHGSALLAVAISTLSGCGGKAVVDGTANSGGNSASSTSSQVGVTTGSVNSSVGVGSPSSTGSGMVTCDDLTKELEFWIGEATRCDACDDGPDPCEYGEDEVTDVCGCPVPLNATINAASEAITAHRNWLEAGCGPFDCQIPCGVSLDPICLSNGNCQGTCR